MRKMGWEKGTPRASQQIFYPTLHMRNGVWKQKKKERLQQTLQNILQK
jgi:hypothetical protein